MNRITTLTIATAISITAVAAHADTTGITRTDLNMRKGPSTAYDIITVLPQNAAIIVHECADNSNWCNVSFNRARGWVAGNYLAYGEQEVSNVIASTPRAGGIGGLVRALFNPQMRQGTEAQAEVEVPIEEIAPDVEDAAEVQEPQNPVPAAKGGTTSQRLFPTDKNKQAPGKTKTKTFNKKKTNANAKVSAKLATVKNAVSKPRPTITAPKIKRPTIKTPVAKRPTVNVPRIKAPVVNPPKLSSLSRKTVSKISAASAKLGSITR